jgi:hypothetical protein
MGLLEKVGYYGKIALVSALIFTILLLAVGLIGVFKNAATASGTFAILSALLIIMSVGLVGTAIAARNKEPLSNAFWYQLLVGFFAALTLIVLSVGIASLFGIPGGFAWSGISFSSLFVLMFAAIFLDAFISIFIWELIGHGLGVLLRRLRH